MTTLTQVCAYDERQFLIRFYAPCEMRIYTNADFDMRAELKDILNIQNNKRGALSVVPLLFTHLASWPSHSLTVSVRSARIRCYPNYHP